MNVLASLLKPFCNIVFLKLECSFMGLPGNLLDWNKGGVGMGLKCEFAQVPHSTMWSALLRILKGSLLLEFKCNEILRGQDLQSCKTYRLVLGFDLSHP